MQLTFRSHVRKSAPTCHSSQRIPLSSAARIRTQPRCACRRLWSVRSTNGEMNVFLANRTMLITDWPELEASGSWLLAPSVCTEIWLELSLSRGWMSDLVNRGSDKPVRTFYKGRTCGGCAKNMWGQGKRYPHCAIGSLDQRISGPLQF